MGSSYFCDNPDCVLHKEYPGNPDRITLNETMMPMYVREAWESRVPPPSYIDVGRNYLAFPRIDRDGRPQTWGIFLCDFCRKVVEFVKKSQHDTE